MSTWTWILAACAIAYVTKGVGYLIPRRLLEHERIIRVAGTMTIGLLAALVVMNTFATARQLTVDARVVSLVVAVVAFRLRAPFLLVVVLGAASAALVRLSGWG